MSKTLVIGAAARASVAAAAGAVYYVSPTHRQNLDSPPILVDGTPDEVLGKLRHITVQRYLEQMGGREEELRLFRFETRSDAASQASGTVYFASDRVLILRANVRAVAGGKSELDIVAELPRSRFTSQPSLHPYDLKMLAAYADLVATDYASSVLKGDRPLSGGELVQTLETRSGFDGNQKEAFGGRLERALRGAYGREIDEAEHRGHEHGRPRYPDDYGPDVEPPLPPENLNGSPGVDLSRYDRDYSGY